MKTKKITAAIFSAVSFLFLTGTMSYGQAFVNCPAGKIRGASSGSYGTATLPTQRYVFLQCNTLLGTWAANTSRRFKIMSTHDQDGKYATALTALALTNETVRFTISAVTQDSQVYAIDLLPATF